MLKLEDFIEKYYKDLNSRDIATIKTYYKEFTELLEEQKDKEQALNNRDFLLSFFALRRTSPNVFYHQKAFLKNFYNECIDDYNITNDILDYINTLRLPEVISSEQFKLYYFKDLDDLLNYITFVGKQYGFLSENDMLQQKAVVVLAWYGVMPEEMPLIKKYDLRHESYSLYLPHRDKLIEMPPQHYEVVMRFSVSVRYFGFPSKKPLVYKSSPYLFRSGYKEQMSPYNINQIIQRFNNEASNFGKLISIKALRINALFVSIRKLSASNNLTIYETMDKLGYLPREKYAYKTLYLKWLSIFW